MDDLLQLGKEALASQPFSVFVGAELTGYSPGWAELTVPITPELKQQHGFVHGGVVSYAADNALTFVGASVLGSAVVTSEYKINYLRPVVGTALTARATVIYSGKSQAVCRCDVFVIEAGEETLCATAQGTIARIGRSSESQA
ncbi:MAG: PaaI family thioesterase [Chloroflexi bacterium]|nr:PaaI family thioesterase [Chloroflexota bacterium]